jgi:bifunctional non-homologous end joining protein LigD
MLATLVDRPFDRRGWWFEVKWDGYRAIAEIEEGQARLYSRTGLSLDEKFTALLPSLRTFAHDALFDGEVVVVDEEGKPQFEWLQGYPRGGKGRLVYYVFDLLYLDGQDLRSLPLWRRKELLRPLLRGFPNILFSDHVEEKGVAFFNAAAAQSLEGIVGKKATSTYQSGRRSRDWVKLKTHLQQEAVIAGYTEPRGSRQALGAVVLGVYEGDELVYIGHAGSGFTDRSLADVYARLQPLVQKKCPFRKRPPKNDTPVHWVEPRLVCEVRFREWTSEGHIRHPVFLGLTEDQPARSVRREVPEKLSQVLPASTRDERPEESKSKKLPVGSSVRTAKRMPLGSRKEALPFSFTNLDKVYWPEDGYTKGDLINYYREVAPFILPYLRDRPLSLHRHPDGIHGESFFQKDVSKQLPATWIRTVLIPSGHGGRTIRYMTCDNDATLLYMANLGCIELNCWTSRVQSLDRPDYLVIDLDPQDTPYSEVIETAQLVRELLEKGCAPCFCKTSGKRGMHIYVPLGARYDFDQARQFGEIVARLVHRKLPRFTSIVRDPAKRRQRVYIDFLQNRRAQTMASVYSVRPVPGARVSTPLLWKEVTKKLDPGKFTIRTLPRRLEKVGDVWEGLLESTADLSDCLTRLQSLSRPDA